MSELNTKFKVDAVFNMFALGFGSLLGLGVNYCISMYLGDAALGSFVQLLVMMMMIGQLAPLGTQLSTQKHCAANSEHNRTISTIIYSALLISFICSILSAFLLFLLKPFIEPLFNSDRVSAGFIYLILILPFFACNKVLLSALNGLRRIKSFAFLQMMRYVFIAFYLFLYLTYDFKSNIFFIVFLSEVSLSIAASCFCFKHLLYSPPDFKFWIKKHILFGYRSCILGCLIESNTRVDIVMLGIFLSDDVVGQYSYAAMGCEGVLMFFSVLRNNVNPILSKMCHNYQWIQLKEFIAKGSKGALITGIPVILIAITGFWGATVFFPILRPALLPFVVIVCGVTIACPLLPFDFLLLQAGRPGLQAGIVLVCFCLNILMNYFLIPYCGPLGAAIATAVTYPVAICFLIYCSERFIHKGLFPVPFFCRQI